MNFIALTILFCVCCLSSISADQQTIGVQGVLMCGDQPAANVKVKLYDADSGIDLDDLMAEGTTDSLGHFLLHGTENEILNIDPKLNIYHDCEDNLRKISIGIPKSYIASGRAPSRYFDLGILNLEAEFEDEERDCLH